MAVDFQITQLTNRPYIRMQLWEPDGTHPDLTGATVRFVLKSTGGTVVLNTTSVTIIDPILATLEYHWATADTAVAGDYLAQVKVTRVDGSLEAYPDDDRYIDVRINATLA
jgi:hypothetical protein